MISPKALIKELQLANQRVTRVTHHIVFKDTGIMAISASKLLFQRDAYTYNDGKIPQDVVARKAEIGHETHELAEFTFNNHRRYTTQEWIQLKDKFHM